MKSIIAYSVFIAVLAGCGGGDSDQATNSRDIPSDKYVGSWTSNCLRDTGVPYKTNFIITKIDDTRIHIVGNDYDYNSNDSMCTGDVEFVEGPYEHNITIVGTKTIDGASVDKFDVTQEEGLSSKAIGFVKDGKLYSDLIYTDDNTDYPSLINYTQYLTKDKN